MLLEFVMDSKIVNKYNELSGIYTSEYYRRKIKKYFDKNNKTVFKNMIKLYHLSLNKEIDKICNNMNTYLEIKRKTMLNKTQEYNVYNICSEGYLCSEYEVVLDYITDVLTTCTCIAELLFINIYAMKSNESDEFFKIVNNMSKEIKDLEIISKKTKPLFDEFYASKYGHIDSEEIYSIFIKIILNMGESKKSQFDNIIKLNDIQELDEFLNNCIKKLSEQDDKVEIYSCILNQIKNIIDTNNYYLFMSVIKQMNKYVDIYNEKKNKINKNKTRERYLKGDFSIEKEELNEEFDLNNISTGTQFELYLTQLFKKLGYKTMHNGKAGDQGADLLLKKNNYIYAVQAKFYSDKLSNTPIQEIVGALKYYNANQGVVVTNSYFTKGAQDLAKANNVILIDGNSLKKLINCIFDEESEEDILQKFII